MTPEQAIKWTNIATIAFCSTSVIHRLVAGEFITNGLIFLPLIPFCIYGINASFHDWKVANKKYKRKG